MSLRDIFRSRGLDQEEIAKKLHEGLDAMKRVSAIVDESLSDHSSDLYYCPTVQEVESRLGGGFDVCCEHPEKHLDMPDTPATHEISKLLSERAKIPAQREEKRIYDKDADRALNDPTGQWGTNPSYRCWVTRHDECRPDGAEKGCTCGCGHAGVPFSAEGCSCAPWTRKDGGRPLRGDETIDGVQHWETNGCPFHEKKEHQEWR